MEQPRRNADADAKDTQDSAIGTFSISVDAARDDAAEGVGVRRGGGARLRRQRCRRVRLLRERGRAEAGGTYSDRPSKRRTSGERRCLAARLRGAAAKRKSAIVDAAPFLDVRDRVDTAAPAARRR